MSKELEACNESCIRLGVDLNVRRNFLGRVQRPTDPRVYISSQGHDIVETVNLAAAEAVQLLQSMFIYLFFKRKEMKKRFYFLKYCLLKKNRF